MPDSPTPDSPTPDSPTPDSPTPDPTTPAPNARPPDPPDAATPDAPTPDAPTPGAPTPDALAYELTINGRSHAVPSAWLGESLLYVLRERLGMPGSKNACDQGECGSCSILFDGDLVCACCVMAADAVDADVRTVEGLAPSVGRGDVAPGAGRESDADGEVSDVQQAFLDEGAVQCGFCIPGMIVAVHDLLDHDPAADELRVREALSGNLCRCTGYGRILQAVATVQDRRAGVRP
jgi:aerobic-type carbon monoxide dehydrogenase small subunit (CoxS/CutS family)